MHAPPPPLRHSFLLFSSFDIAMATTTTTTATRKFGGVHGARVRVLGKRAPQSRRLSLVRAADDGDSKATTTTSSSSSSSSFDVVDSERIKAERCVPHSAYSFHFVCSRILLIFIFMPRILSTHPPNSHQPVTNCQHKHKRNTEHRTNTTSRRWSAWRMAASFATVS